MADPEEAIFTFPVVSRSSRILCPIDLISHSRFPIAYSYRLSLDSGSSKYTIIHIRN